MSKSDLVKVKLTASMSGDRFSLVSGDVIECDAAEAERLIAANLAVAAPKEAQITANRGPTFAEVPHGEFPGETPKLPGGNGLPPFEDSPRAPAAPAAGAPSQSGRKGKGNGNENPGDASGEK